MTWHRVKARVPALVEVSPGVCIGQEVTFDTFVIQRADGSVSWLAPFTGSFPASRH